MDRRAYYDALREIPAKHRAWLELDPSVDDRAFPLFCFHGFGVMVNSAQEEAAAEVFRKWPPGTAHVWRWANRTGKTTGVDLIDLLAIWKKWRYINEDFDSYLAYEYKVLHAAPLNKLMGKAWGMIDSMLAHAAEQQLSPLTNRPRPAILLPFFAAGTGRAADGSDEVWVKSMNGGKIDYLSTQAGAGRMESDKWWLLTWDEFPRQQPVEDVPLLIDQTFLPRSSDFMAPLIFAGTATEDAEPVYAEIEDMAERTPNDWNFSTKDRRVNFSQSKESIDRQLRMSFDKETAGRSVEGLSGQAGYGLFAKFAIDNAFTESLPERTKAIELPAQGAGYRFLSSFDHAANGDENIAETWACPWPPQTADLVKTPILAVSREVLKSSRSLTPYEQLEFVQRQEKRYPSLVWLFDGTGEAGILLSRMAARNGIPVRAMSYNARMSPSLPPNKDLALQWLQRLLTLGMQVDIDEEGWAEFDPTLKAPDHAFGGVRFPAEWRRDKRQMQVYKRFDAKLTQDRVMSKAMLSWHVWPLYDGAARRKPQKFNIMARRRRTLVAGGR